MCFFRDEGQLTTLQNVKAPMLYALVCFYYVGTLFLVQLQDKDLQFD